MDYAELRSQVLRYTIGAGGLIAAALFGVAWIAEVSIGLVAMGLIIVGGVLGPLFFAEDTALGSASLGTEGLQSGDPNSLVSGVNPGKGAIGLFLFGLGFSGVVVIAALTV